ncbi:MAG: glucosamine-6-phosphate deaminase [Saprospiraceae bacterium]|nr:glucosamine-6-phosphate deaminase [Saprospiraceae bacterium]
MRILIHEEYDSLSKWIAYYVARKINLNGSSPDNPFVLGLPTGSSPLGTYEELIRLNKAGKVSFQNVVTFNMDEYVGLPEDHPESYHYFMEENFFKHIDIPRKNINILDGNAPDLEKECEEFEKKIGEAGGIHLFMGGIGVDGHLAFNEPGSSMTSKTRIKTLTLDTRIANSRFFDNDISKVPETALTVGLGTIMSAEEVLIIINGYKKARALFHVVELGINHMWTGSMLQLHQHGIIVCDDEATMELKVGTVKYFKEIERHHLENLPELSS